MTEFKSKKNNMAKKIIYTILVFVGTLIAILILQDITRFIYSVLMLDANIKAALQSISLDANALYQIILLIATILAIVLYKCFSKTDVGLTKGNWKLGIKLSLIGSVLILISTFIKVITLPAIDLPLNTISLPYDKITYDYITSCVLAPIAEELLFRSLLITVLSKILAPKPNENNTLAVEEKRGLFKTLNSSNLVPPIVAAIAFSMAHIGVTFFPFSIDFSLRQTVSTMFLGLLTGYVFVKTKSVYYCIYLHFFANFCLQTYIVISFIAYIS